MATPERRPSLGGKAPVPSSGRCSCDARVNSWRHLDSPSQIRKPCHHLHPWLRIQVDRSCWPRTRSCLLSPSPASPSVLTFTSQHQSTGSLSRVSRFPACNASSIPPLFYFIYHTITPTLSLMGVSPSRLISGFVLYCIFLFGFGSRHLSSYHCMYCHLINIFYYSLISSRALEREHTAQTGGCHWGIGDIMRSR
ncbi:hypothetical protein OE88DRAFT_1160928 [Heliocybe sulcata]|uniref:Uncharacterized protein n=1 Tax=Heliocybe sulcata TaxID=5364 RepID=A0A5C3NCP4_9AGAM|nr:hypothetical protein OE88DRAFT_1160928 [Heliocybe sulcata]